MISNRYWLSLIAAILFPAAQPCGSAAEKACSAFESDKSIEGRTSIYRSNRYPWTVTSDIDGKVVIKNTEKHTECTTNIGSVASVYVGKGKRVYLRSLEIASDELFVLDGFSCKEAHRPIELDLESQEKSLRILRANRVCPSK